MLRLLAPYLHLVPKDPFQYLQIFTHLPPIKTRTKLASNRFFNSYKVRKNFWLMLNVGPGLTINLYLPEWHSDVFGLNSSLVINATCSILKFDWLYSQSQKLWINYLNRSSDPDQSIIHKIFASKAGIVRANWGSINFQVNSQSVQGSILSVFKSIFPHRHSSMSCFPQSWLCLFDLRTVSSGSNELTTQYLILKLYNNLYITNF